MGPHDISCFGALSIPAGDLAGKKHSPGCKLCNKIQARTDLTSKDFPQSKTKPKQNLHSIFMETQWQMHQIGREGEYKEVFEMLAEGWVWQAIKSK